jgi:selenoprotein W-related protein
LTTKLLNTFGQDIKSLKLVPSGGGVFEVDVEGKLMHSKKAVGKFPDEALLIEQIGKQFVK